MSKNLGQYLGLYLEKLKQNAKEDLRKNYNFESILDNDFDIINANFINKTLNQNEYNLFIQTVLSENRRSYYFPVIIAVAASLFFKNYCDDKTEYNIGDILQKDGIRYIINAIYPEYYEVISFHKRGVKKTTRIYKTENLKKYIITTADLSNRRVNTRFDNYKAFFNNLFEVDYFPSKFSYKSVIILEKKSFLDELKYHSQIDFKKSIPFQWIGRNGINKIESEYIPIEPMIYLTSDYETFQDHISNKIENLDSVIFIGKNKYESNIAKIKKDIRRSIIPKAIFIGDEEIKDVNNLLKWKWTYAEICFLNNTILHENNIIEVTADCLIESVSDFKNFIKGIETEFNIDCKSIIYFTRYIYSIIMIGFRTRLDNHLNFVENILKEKTETVISENLYSINQNPKQYIEASKEKINEIFRNLDCSKFINFIIQDKIDILIVPNRQKNAWNELVELFTHLSNKRTKVLSLNEFMKIQSLFSTTQNVYLLSLFGFNCNFQVVIELLSKTPHKINYIIYSEEKYLLQNELKQTYKQQLNDYQSTDRIQLGNIHFPNFEEIDSIHNKIEELYLDFTDYSHNYNYDLSDHVYYKVTFETSEIEVLDGNRSVILESNYDNPQKEKVSNLINGDKIRIYENADREKLLSLAIQEDNEGRLEEIFFYSRFWKKSLLEFFNNVDNVLYNEETLLKDLKQNGAQLKLPTLTNWLDLNNNNMFPHSIENLRAIQKTIKNAKFDSEFTRILKCRKLYRGIMISLGHNLSEELNDYIISKKKIKGEFLQKFSDNQIDVFLKHTAPIRTIKNIEISERGMDE